MPATTRVLSGFFYAQDQALAEGVECFLDAGQLGGVVGIEHSPDFLFITAQFSSQSYIREPGFPHGEIQGGFGGHGRRDGDQPFARFGARRGGDFHASLDAGCDRGLQAIGGLPQSVFLIATVPRPLPRHREMSLQ